MVIYKDPRTTKKVSIPSTPDSEVEIYNTLLWKDVEEINLSDNPLLSGQKVLVKLIKDWNLTNENGEKLPITMETLSSFTMDDVNFLLSQTELGKSEGSGEDKKKVENKS